MPYTALRCLFITSSYSSRCLRASKFCTSTTCCAAAKLIVDSTRFVPLRAENMQPAHGDHLVVLAVGFRFDLGQRCLPLLGRNLVGVFTLLAQVLARLHLRIAAEKNVGAAAGHV